MLMCRKIQYCILFVYQDFEECTLSLFHLYICSMANRLARSVTEYYIVDQRCIYTSSSVLVTNHNEAS